MTSRKPARPSARRATKATSKTSSGKVAAPVSKAKTSPGKVAAPVKAKTSPGKIAAPVSKAKTSPGKVAAPVSKAKTSPGKVAAPVKAKTSPGKIAAPSTKTSSRIAMRRPATLPSDAATLASFAEVIKPRANQAAPKHVASLLDAPKTAPVVMDEAAPVVPVAAPAVIDVAIPPPPRLPSEAPSASTAALDSIPPPTLPPSVDVLPNAVERVLRELGLDADAALRMRAADALSALASRLQSQPDERLDETGDPATFFDSREGAYAERHWGRSSMRDRAEFADEFGADTAFDARMRPIFEQLYRTYFRVTTRGLDNVTSAGRTLLVANHSGTFPWDGLMLKMALALEHPQQLEARWLIEDFIFHAPFVGAALNRLGAVRACQENAERLLAQDKLTAVFPEGVQGMGKLFNQRYQLQRFGRGGYVKLALRTGARIVPVAIVGAEESSPLIFKLSALAKPLGLPYIPVTPLFPWLGPLGLLPLPAKWSITFGEPIELGDYGPEAANDAIVVNRLNERVRATVQTLVDEAVSSRSSVVFG